MPPDFIRNIFDLLAGEAAGNVRELVEHRGPAARRGFRAIGLLFLFVPPAFWLWATYGPPFDTLLFAMAFAVVLVVLFFLLRLDWVVLTVEALGLLGDTAEAVGRRVGGTAERATAGAGRTIRSATNVATTAAVAWLVLISYAFAIPEGYETRRWVMVTAIIYLLLMLLVLPRGRWSGLKSLLFVVLFAGLVGTVFATVKDQPWWPDSGGGNALPYTAYTPPLEDDLEPYSSSQEEEWEMIPIYQIGDQAQIALPTDPDVWYRLPGGVVTDEVGWAIWPAYRSSFTVTYRGGHTNRMVGGGLYEEATACSPVIIGELGDFRFLDGEGWVNVVLYDKTLPNFAGLPSDVPPPCP